MKPDLLNRTSGQQSETGRIGSFYKTDSEEGAGNSDSVP